MASNFGDREYGNYGEFRSDGSWHWTGDENDTWAWFRGHSSWNVGFLHTYPITMFLGVLIAFLSVVVFWRRMKYSWEILQVMVIIIVPSSIVGARLWYLISEGGWSDWYILSGLSIQGGVMGACLAVIPFVISRRHAVDFRTVIGMVLPAVIIGQAIGRWGNFDNHEVYGKVVDGDSLNWLTFIKPHMLIANHPSEEAAYRFPLFFMESMFNLAGYLVLLWLVQRKNWLKPGVPAALYLIWYGVTRFIMEPMRDPVDIMKLAGMNISSVVAGLWITAGVVMFIWWQGFTKPFDKWMIAIFGAERLNRWSNAKIYKYNVIREYEAIYPVKPRKVMFFGEETTKKGKYLLYWGPKVDNKVKLWLPVEKDEKWSKRDINRGRKINNKQNK